MTGPILRLTISDPATLNDVAKWARIAEALGVPSSSSVKAGYDTVSVSAYLAYVPDPEDAEEDEEAAS